MGCLYGKVSGNSLSELANWIEVLGNYLGRVPWRLRYGYHLHLHAGGGGVQQKYSKFYQHFCLRESCPYRPCPEARQFSSSPHVPGAFRAAAPLLELRVNEFVSK